MGNRFVKFVVSVGGDTFRHMWSRIGRRIPSEAEVTEVAESLMRMLEEHFEEPPPPSLSPAPSEEPVAVTHVEQPSKQYFSKQPLMQKQSAIDKQNNGFNKSRRVDSPAPRKRQSTKESSQ